MVFIVIAEDHPQELDPRVQMESIGHLNRLARMEIYKDLLGMEMFGY